MALIIPSSPFPFWHISFPLLPSQPRALIWRKVATHGDCDHSFRWKENNLRCHRIGWRRGNRTHPAAPNCWAGHSLGHSAESPLWFAWADSKKKKILRGGGGCIAPEDDHVLCLTASFTVQRQSWSVTHSAAGAVFEERRSVPVLLYAA